MKLTISGKDFKALIDGVTRFPSIGAFVGSELVHISASNGYVTATTFAVTLSRCRKAAVGELPLIAIDERLLIPFASLCADQNTVRIEVTDKQISLYCKSKKIEAAYIAGQEYKFPSKVQLEKMYALKLTTETAKQISYLAEIAFSDASKPELCCVYLTDTSYGLAINQKVMAVLKLGIKGGRNVAVPIPLAKTLINGDTVYAGEKETVVKSGAAMYCMPSPTKAQTDFPRENMLGMTKVPRDKFMTCDGDALYSAFSDCDSVLGQMARTEVLIHLSCTVGKLNLLAERGGAKFTNSLAVSASESAGAVILPLEELMRAAPLFQGEKVVQSLGTKKGEVFMEFKSGWVVFPPWTKDKK